MTTMIRHKVPHFSYPAGTEIAGYTIRHGIEVRGRHESYHAADSQEGAPVVLQTFRLPDTDDLTTTGYMLDGMRKWLTVRQPNIAEVLEAGLTRDAVFFSASAKPTGISLLHSLRRNGTMSILPALRLTLSLSQIMNWLWTEHGIIYGGLHPGNILITPSRDILLANRVLAPILRDRPAGMSLAAMTGLGSGFLSPEMIQTPDDADCRSDLFSTGSLLYLLLTGQPAFPNGSQAGTYIDPRLYCPEIPELILMLIKMLLSHAPDDRLRNWEALIDMLSYMERHFLSAPDARPPKQGSSSVANRVETIKLKLPSRHVSEAEDPFMDTEASLAG